MRTRKKRVSLTPALQKKDQYNQAKLIKSALLLVDDVLEVKQNSKVSPWHKSFVNEDCWLTWKQELMVVLSNSEPHTSHRCHQKKATALQAALQRVDTPKNLENTLTPRLLMLLKVLLRPEQQLDRIAFQPRKNVQPFSRSLVRSVK